METTSIIRSFAMLKKKSMRLHLAMLLQLTIGLASLAQAQHNMRITQIRPAIAAPGELFELIGVNLDNPNLTKAVLISRLVDDGPPDFVGLNEVSWVDDNLVRVNIPEELPVGNYLIKIENDASEQRGRSNMQRLAIRASKSVKADAGTAMPFVPSVWPSMLIERVIVQGRTIALEGKHFGRYQESRNVTIHQLDGDPYVRKRLEVLSWTDTRIQARAPIGLAPGKYFVLVNYDEAWGWGSNSSAAIILPPEISQLVRQAQDQSRR
jgi:hypothetical protein